jgi:multidrug efflux pump subunit AcrA (membrane-fusion protein)
MKQPLMFAALLTAALTVSACSLLPETQVNRASSNEPPTPTPIPTAVVPMQPRYTVKRGEVVDEVVFNGRVSPVIEEELFFRTDGRVRATYAKRDDMLEEGQVIAEFEIAALERALISAELELERATSRLESAQRDLDFDIETAKSNLEIAQLELARLRAAAVPDQTAVQIQEERVRLAEIAVERLDSGVDPLLRNDVARAQLDVDRLSAEISESTISAPFTGQLLSMSLIAGQGVEAYRPVASIADVNSLEIAATLMSSQMDGLEEGMEVKVTAARRPGLELTGIIRQLPYPYGSGGNPSVSNVEERDATTRIELNESLEEAGMELGDLVRVEVVRERKDDVLWLPPQALRNFDGRRFAVLEEEGSQRRVDVVVGVETTERVEIEEGLEEGQTVVGQ